MRGRGQRAGRTCYRFDGPLFGGSIYGAVDPIYVLMLIKNLGPDYVVWDKAASIQFKRPGRSTLYARFTLEQAELDAIRTELETARSVDRVFHVELTDKAGTVCATVATTIYVRRVAPSAHDAGFPLASARPA